jgi:L-2,4-diaminobutyric acid acetyltransferase
VAATAGSLTYFDDRSKTAPMQTADHQRAPESGGLAIRVEGRLELRAPTQSDGLEVHALIAACPPLDVNSAYCNLLQCTHFAQYCVVATKDGELVGWVSGYAPPDEPDTIFVWQVAVASAARGLGLGRRMLVELLARDACKTVCRLKTTITAQNTASRALFSSVAKSLGAEIAETPWLLEREHLPSGHPTENLFTIGPFAPRSA